jgi:hypothetical protein
MNNYKTITVREIVDYINANPDIFKNGLDTKIYTGDFEGNYTHIMHSVERDSHKSENVIFLGYEMHEDYGR